MRQKVSGLDVTVKLVRFMDKVVNAGLSVIILVVLSFGIFGLVDTYLIYAGAELDKDLLKYKPGNGESELTLADLREINADVCGWLTVDETKIDYPVVQGEDNWTYINQNVKKESSMSGSVFLDCNNAGDFSDFYSLLHGHHMEGEVMFGVLPRYKEKSFFDSHRSGMLYTLEKTYRIRFFACVYASAYDRIVYRPADHETSENKQALLAHIKENAQVYADEGVTEEDRIIGLSTCYDVRTDGRIIVYGTLEEINE